MGSLASCMKKIPGTHEYKTNKRNEAILEFANYLDTTETQLKANKERVEGMANKFEQEARMYKNKKNIKKAKEALKEKIRYTKYAESIQNAIDRIRDSAVAVHSAFTMQSVHSVMEKSATILSVLGSDVKIKDVDKTTDSLCEKMTEINDMLQVLSRPLDDGSIGIDDDDLQKELDALDAPNDVNETGDISLGSMNSIGNGSIIETEDVYEDVPLKKQEKRSLLPQQKRSVVA